MDHFEDETNQGALKGWVIGLIQLVFVIGIITVAIALTQVLKGNVSDRAPKIADLRGASEITIRIADLEIADYTPIVRVNGTVQAAAEVSVSPQVSGEIKWVSSAFRPGADLEKGAKLFEIDRADYLLAVQRAESEIAAASSDLQQLEAEAAIAVEEWQELYPGREVNPLAARIPQIEAAKARLASAEANKSTSELSLSRTRVYAPADARVLASSLDVGQIVSPGQVVGRMVALERIELAVPVSLDQLSMLEPATGRLAEFQRRSADAPAKPAIVTRVDATLDPRTRLSTLYLRPEVQSGLRIGDFVDVAIKSDPIVNAIEIPASALAGQTDVWVMEQGMLADRTVRVLGEKESGNTIVVAPFDIAEGVIAIPPLDAKVGQKVGVRQVEDVRMAAGGRSDAAE